MPETERSRRIAALADACVKCGLCLPHCPTYALDAVETESPRGRIALAAGAAAGRLAASQQVRLHLDYCLGCMACERVCPVPVEYGALLAVTRALLPAAGRRPRVLLALLSRPRWLRAGAVLARFTAARHWLPPLAHMLPAASALRAAIDLLPVLPLRAQPSQITGSREVPPRGRVALFGGCVQGVFERDAQDALAVLLGAAGFRVMRIGSICCGALAAHTGDARRAETLAARAREAFADSGADTLLSATSGCLGTLRAALPQARIEDALAFLDANAGGLRFRPLDAHAALHLPCTQVNVARAGDAVRRLLARISGLRIDVLPTQGQCCGAAGSHMLEFPQRAAALRDRVLDALPRSAPQLLLTSNIGCHLHLAAGLRECGAHVAIEHPLTLLARQLDA